MFNFQHEVQDVNLIITALEHKARDIQLLIQKLTKEASAQLPAQTIEATVVPSTDTSANS
jgi:hypothetical protein